VVWLKQGLGWYRLFDADPPPLAQTAFGKNYPVLPRQIRIYCGESFDRIDLPRGTRTAYHVAEKWLVVGAGSSHMLAVASREAQAANCLL